MSPEMTKNLSVVCAEVEKKYGKGAIMRLTDQPEIQADDIISSGSIQLDVALGIGGYKKGRIIEIIGPESTGKSTLCLHAVVQAQKQGKTCAYIDAEQSLDKNYALALGVRLDDLLIVQPDNGEQALDIADMLVRSNEIELIVIDSVAALVPKSELEGEIGDFSVGAQARLMSQACRMLVGVCNKTGCTIIFTNQIRYKIGVKFGNPETTSGGNALKFYASTRIDLRRTGDTKVKEEIVGIDVKAKIIKNKCAPPKREAEFSISYGKGINRDQELLNLAIGDQLIEKAGAWFKYNGDTIAQGEASALVWLKENPTIKDEIFKQVMELRGLA